MNTRILLVIIAVLIGIIGYLLIGKSPTGSTQSEPTDMLPAIREAAQSQMFSGPIGQIVLEGAATVLGTDGTFKLALAKDGRYALTIESEMGDSLGFDSATGWAVDSSGMPRKLSSNESAWNYLIMAVITGHWADGSSPFQVTKSEKSGKDWIVTVSHRTEPFTAEIHFDEESLRPIMLFRTGSQEHSVIEFSSYKQANGVNFPQQIKFNAAGLPIRSLVVHRLAIGHQIEEILYRPVITRPADTRFDKSIPAEIEVKRVVTGHFLIRPKINDEALGWFILDSGGGVSTISQSAASKLNLAQIGKTPLISIFGVQESPIYRADSLQVGPVIIENPDFTEMDLEAISQAFGVTVEGVIGYPLFARAVIEIEVASDRIALYDPEKYRANNVDWEELILDHQHPVVKASFEGDREGLFRLDIGAGQSTVIFHGPAVEQLKLLEGRETTKQNAGQFELAVGQIDWLELAGERFEDLTVGFAMGNAGPFGDAYATGNIGNGVLKPFKVVFDYTNSRIAFIKLAAH